MATDQPLNKGPHDLGGEPAGPIDTTDHGMRHWERQANGFRNAVTNKKILTVDELRRAAEDLGEDYYRLDYFERTTMAMRTMLLEKGFFTADELTKKMAQVRARFNVPDEMESPIKTQARK